MTIQSEAVVSQEISTILGQMKLLELICIKESQNIGIYNTDVHTLAHILHWSRMLIDKYFFNGTADARDIAMHTYSAFRTFEIGVIFEGLLLCLPEDRVELDKDVDQEIKTLVRGMDQVALMEINWPLHLQPNWSQAKMISICQSLRILHSNLEHYQSTDFQMSRLRESLETCLDVAIAAVVIFCTNSMKNGKDVMYQTLNNFILDDVQLFLA